MMEKKVLNGDHLPSDYYDIHLEEDKEFSIETPTEDSLMVFTLLGEIIIGQEKIEEKTAVKLTEGDLVKIKAINGPAQVLYMKSKALKEPVARAGPIVMNTRKELVQAFEDLDTGNFICIALLVLIKIDITNLIPWNKI